MELIKIRDAIARVGQNVSVVGVVIQFSFSARSRGTDKFCGMKIVDESHQKPGLQVNIFASDFGALPHVLAPGDIIQLSNIKIAPYDSETNAVFNKKISKFALYKGTGSGGFVPYQASPRFLSRETNKPFITSLRNWFANFQLDDDSHCFRSVMDAKENVLINLVCKIIHVQEFSEDEWMAFVWDGTDMKPNKLSLRLEEEEKNSLPLHLEPSHLSRETLLKFPTVGSILRVVVFDEWNKKRGFQLLNTNIGKWMKLINVSCEVHAGIWQGVLPPSTKVRYATEVDTLVSERKREYDARLRMTNKRISSWSFPWVSSFTEVDHKDNVFVTLMDVLTYPEDSAEFVCVVRVLAICPSLPKDFRAPCGLYRIRVTLEDSTARIHAFLFDKDAEKFFGDSPCEEILTRKRNVLLGVKTEESDRNPPWVQCCLKSYCRDNSDIWGTRQFEISNTKMID